MENNTKSDLRIDGSGSASGGNYNFVKINGTGKINGDVCCDEMIINGSGNTTGKIEGQLLKVNGSGRFGDTVKVKEIKVNGSADFENGINCDGLNISGSAKISQEVNAQQIRLNGSAKIGGNCNAENFQSKGLFTVGGLLNADDIDVNLYWSRSSAREIGGENISVKLGSQKFNILKSVFSFGMNDPGLNADTIEGDEIYLENTTAKVVRGNHITIGSGCDIGLVEYKSALEKSGDSRIAQEKKI